MLALTHLCVLEKPVHHDHQVTSLKVVQEYMRKLRISTDNGMPSFISVSNSVTKPFSYKVDGMPYYMHEMVINEVCC